MNSSVTKLVMALGLVVIGIAIGLTGIYVGDTDDAPGAAHRQNRDPHRGRFS